MFRRFGTPFASDWIAKNINGYVYTAAIPADPALRAEATEYQARYVPRVPRDGEYAGAIGAYLGFVLPALRRRTSSTGGRTACARRSSATSPTSTASDYDAASLRRARRPARGRDRRPRPPLEDPLDAQLRPVLGHDGPERRGRGGRAARPTPGCSAACRARSRTATGTRSRTSGSMKEEIKGDDDLRAAFDGADTAARRARGARGLGARPAVRRRAPARAPAGPSATRRSGRTSSRSRPGSRTPRRSSRRSAATWRPTTTTRRTSRASATTSRRPRREVMDGVEGEQRAAAAGGARPLAGDEPADARPPLLHRPGNERAPAPGVHRDRPQAGRAPACSPTPRTSCSCTTTRSACCWPTSRRSATSRSSSPTAATTTRTPPSAARRRGSAPRPRRRWRSRTRRSGASPRSSTPASRRRRGEVKGLAASPGVVEGTARYVASLDEFDQVQRRRHPRVPDDQPRVGRALHEDPRPRDRGRRHGRRTPRSWRASSGSRPSSAPTNAGERIKTGDRIRVNGTTGVVEILA